jgi:hypothetical protein
MPERPAHTAQGIIRRIRDPQRLFEVEMPNGYQSLAVIPKHGPQAPSSPEGRTVELEFSPYDMSQCKIIRWL